MTHNICLMNDSFPPQLDGVANTVVNYATIIEEKLGHSVVVTPEYPNKQDDQYDFPIIRYPSVDIRKIIGYMAGVPFSPALTRQLKEEKIELMHTHCPAASLYLARELRAPLKVPIVFTYHTKFDVDLKWALKMQLLTDQAVRIMIHNINACDEVWTVSQGAGKNLQDLGYEGDFRVMANGVDMPLGRVSDEAIAKVGEGVDLPEGVPVFLFVGRMMWYKGIRLILDALEGLHSQNVDFRMLFIGNGGDFDEIVEYAKELHLDDKVLFLGAIHDREVLRAWYCRANLFIFPSTYDTNGLVVREAAACSLPSLLIKGSCAAEGVEDDVNGFLTTETASSLSVKLFQLASHPELMRQVGENAARDLYLSWETAVGRAYDAYGDIMEKYKSGGYPKRVRISDAMLTGPGELMNALAKLPTLDDFF